jgi:hypothetical protein
MLAGTNEFWERLKSVAKEDYNFFLEKSSELVKDATAKGVANFLESIKKARPKEGDKEEAFPRFVRIASEVIDQVKSGDLPTFLKAKGLKLDCSTCLTAWRQYFSAIALNVGGYLRQWAKDLAEKAKAFLAKIAAKVDELAGKAITFIGNAEKAVLDAARSVKKSGKKQKPPTPEQIAKGETGEVDEDQPETQTLFLFEDDKEFKAFEQDASLFESIKGKLHFENSPTHNGILNPVLESLNTAFAEIREKKVLQIA